MSIIQTLQKWGNGNGVRLSKQIIQSARLQPNQKLSVSVRNGSIILTPIEDPEQAALKALLEGVTPQAIGGELGWGLDMGAERYE